MLAKKLNSSPSMMSYRLLFVASWNTMFSALAVTRMPKLEKRKPQIQSTQLFKQLCPPIIELSRKIRLSLRKNAIWTTTTVHYDWALLNNRDIRDRYTLAQRNKYDALQEKTETLTPNKEYENIINAHLEAAAEFIPTKQRTKSRVPWETLVVREIRADAKTASKYNRKNPTNTNALKLKKAQNELAKIYLKEPSEYIQNQIDKIRDMVENNIG